MRKSTSPKPVGAREAAGDEAASGAAGAAPRGQVDFGASTVLALAPRQAFGEKKDLGVGEAAGFVALQDDPASTRHQRDVVEFEDQHFAIVADKGDRIAELGLNAGPRDRALTWRQHLLAGAGLRHRLLAVDDKAAAVARRDQQLHVGPMREYRDDVVLV